jgi:hypothetical protein
MKFSEAVELHAAEELLHVELMRSPNDRSRWFLVLRDRVEKRYFLVDDNDEVETYASLEDAIAVGRQIGFRTATLHL